MKNENTLKKIISEKATPKNIIVLLVLANAVFLYMIYVSIPNVMEYSNGMKILDLMPMGYSHEYIRTLFEALGKEGRDAYRFGQIPFDMVYPLLSALCYSLMIGFFLKQLNRLDSKLIYLSLLPIVANIFDYLENIGTLLLLNSYPNLQEGLMSATKVFSILKSSFSTIFYTTLIFLLIIWLVKMIRTRTK